MKLLEHLYSGSVYAHLLHLFAIFVPRRSRGFYLLARGDHLNMECFERVKRINNAWEPELCRCSVDREERVCMDIYRTGALAPERHKMTMKGATEYISSMAAVMDIKSMLRDIDHITIRSAKDSRFIYRLTSRFGYAEEEFKAV